MKEIIVLVGVGSLAETVAQAVQGSSSYRVAKVYSSKGDNPELTAQLAKYDIPIKYLNYSFQRQRDDSTYRTSFMHDLLVKILEASPDFVLLVGWPLILPESFTQACVGADIILVNLHPALLSADGEHVTLDDGTKVPVIKGLLKYVVPQVLRDKIPYTGVTIHFIPANGRLDQGPVIMRETILVEPEETEDSLLEKIHQTEHPMVTKLLEYVQSHGSFPDPIA